MSVEKSASHPLNINYFTRGDDFIKQLILEHGNSVCQDQSTQKMIADSIHKFDFGFISATKKAQIGRKKRAKSDDYIVRGFVLCFIEHRAVLHILLFYISSQYKSSGSELMETVIKHAHENPDISQITLNALPELEQYYVKHGFEIYNVIRLKTGEVKIYQMNKRIS